MKRLELRIPIELHQKLKKESFETNKSMNQIVIELIQEHYQKEGEEEND